ncbi:MAG: aminotransferase class I/II-fold pyridoxal phosphate-dependent enzyme [Candidatus Xenobia bacterium]
MREIQRMVEQWSRETQVAFCIPGHGGGRAVGPAVRDFLGAAAFRADVTQARGIDDVLAVDGAFAALRQRAARLWHAEETWLLGNGSSGGVIAMMLAALQPGETVVMPRGIHMSALWGLILSGAVPHFLPLRLDPVLQVALPPSEAPQQASVFAVSPTYFGHIAPVRELAGGVHAFNKVLMVDEAWGAHLGFLDRLPANAMQCGADLATASLHKMLGGLSGTAVLHRRGSRVDAPRLYSAVLATSTTSPYYGAFISVEAVVDTMAQHGSATVERMLAVAETLRQELKVLPGIEVAPPADDPTRVAFAADGWTGDALEGWLRDRGVAVEMAMARHVLLVVGPSHRRYDARLMARTLRHLPRRQMQPIQVALADAPLAMTPREAWFAPRRCRTTVEATGQVAAEPWCIYPPGVPALLPGERISAEVLDGLRQAAAAGARILGPADATLDTVQTVA